MIKNKTLMPHPIHLHGHEFQVVEIDGKRLHGAVRDSVLVTPGTRVVIAFDANNPGSASSERGPGTSRRRVAKTAARIKSRYRPRR
jgi:Multicopper oxidase